MSLTCASPLSISPCLDAARGCADKARQGCAADFVTTQVTIRTKRWTGGALGDGDSTITDLVLPKAFPVRQTTAREIASSGGRYTADSVVVDGISPPYTSHGGGGFSIDQLDPKRLPTPNKDIEILYILRGEQAGVYTLANLNVSSPTTWSLVLNRTRLTP